MNLLYHTLRQLSTIYEQIDFIFYLPLLTFIFSNDIMYIKQKAFILEHL